MPVLLVGFTGRWCYRTDYNAYLMKRKDKMNEETRGLFNRVANRLGWLQFKDFGKLEEELLQSVKKTEDRQPALSPDLEDGDSPEFQIDCARKLLLSGTDVDSEVSLGTEDGNSPERLETDENQEESASAPVCWVSSEDETDVFADEVSPTTDGNLKSWPANKNSIEVHSTSSSSDDVFESFLTQMKTPKVHPLQVKASTGSMKDFIVSSSSEEDCFLEEFPRVLKPKTENKDVKVGKNNGNKLNLVKMRKLPSENLAPVFLLQSPSEEDSVVIKSTWRDRHRKTLPEKLVAKKENSMIPLFRNQHSDKVTKRCDAVSSISKTFTVSVPDRLTMNKGRRANCEIKDSVVQNDVLSENQSCFADSAGSSDDFESLVEKIKKRMKPQTPGLIVQKDARPCAPNTEPVKKQRPASSDVKNTKKYNKKMSTPWSMPVSLERRISSDPNPSENIPGVHPLGYTEFQSKRSSRVILCPTPGCFLQDLANPASVEAKNFKQKKAELTKRLFSLYNSSIFELKLPEDMEITWNNKMRKTAGYCVTGEKHRHGGDKQRYARIELSDKVCDSADRLRDTLIHELCHAATWLIHGVRDGHGQFWRLYARRSSAVHPELPMVTRCHTYEINYKFTYQCTKCKTTIGRHSKSLDIQRFVCAFCQGQLVLLQSSQRNGTPARTELTPFAKYVKDNYGSTKKELAGTSHAEVMRKLSVDFAKTRISDS